jgi:hypothetical protein
MWNWDHIVEFIQTKGAVVVVQNGKVDIQYPKEKNK